MEKLYTSETPAPQANLATRWVSRRCNISPEIARLIAELAGLQSVNEPGPPQGISRETPALFVHLGRVRA